MHLALEGLGSETFKMLCPIMECYHFVLRTNTIGSDDTVIYRFVYSFTKENSSVNLYSTLSNLIRMHLIAPDSDPDLKNIPQGLVHCALPAIHHHIRKQGNTTAVAFVNVKGHD